MSLAFAWALNTAGVPARIVQMADQTYLDLGPQKGNVHMTVEALIGGKWQISDPTFNVHFKCSTGADNLSLEEAAQCVKDGNEIIGVPGKTQIVGGPNNTRTLETYPVDYEDFEVSRMPMPRDAKVPPSRNILMRAG